MSRRPFSFKESDLLRAIKAAMKAGLSVAGFKITTDGDIEVHTGAPSEKDTGVNPWDEVGK